MLKHISYVSGSKLMIAVFIIGGPVYWIEQLTDNRLIASFALMKEPALCYVCSKSNSYLDRYIRDAAPKIHDFLSFWVWQCGRFLLHIVNTYKAVFSTQIQYCNVHSFV